MRPKGRTFADKYGQGNQAPTHMKTQEMSKKTSRALNNENKSPEQETDMSSEEAFNGCLSFGDWMRENKIRSTDPDWVIKFDKKHKLIKQGKKNKERKCNGSRM